jgi:hypothetical protein
MATFTKLPFVGHIFCGLSVTSFSLSLAFITTELAFGMTSGLLSQVLFFMRGMIRSVKIIDSQLKLLAVFFDILSHPRLATSFFCRLEVNSLL